MDVMKKRWKISLIVLGVIVILVMKSYKNLYSNLYDLII